MTRPLLLSYRTLGIGDLLTAVPALRGLRGAFPEHEHVLAAPRSLAPLVALIDAVDRHLPVAELGQLPAAASRPAVAVNLHGRGPQSHQVLRAAAPQRLVAYHHPDVWPAASAPPWDEHEHETWRWCRLLWANDIAADPADLAIPAPAVPPPAGATGATVIHPGAKSAARRWPPERFAAVAGAERDAGRHVLVTGGPDERPLAAQVADLADLPADAVLAGHLDLGELAAVVAAAGRVVCGDTGVAHLATALGTPSVVLFGPTPPALWGPPVDDRHRVLWAGRRGDPLSEDIDPGLLELTVDDVLRQLAVLDDLAPVAVPSSR